MPKNYFEFPAVSTSTHTSFEIPKSQTSISLRSTANSCITTTPKPTRLLWKGDILYRFQLPNEVMIIPDDQILLQTSNETKQVTIYTENDNEEGWMYSVDTIPSIWRAPATNKT